MAEETNPMEIDVIAAGNPSYGGRASLWVEKYRPQSLDDVAAHRDIVDTSNSL
jgi:replication factor C subunit 3/5